jgi:hypothetical protein
MYRAPEGFEALTVALRDMANAGIGIVVIDGGDGTVREVLSRAPQIWQDAGLAGPEYAIIASGNTNLIARKAGKVTVDDLMLLARDHDAFRRTTIPLLRAERTGLPPLTGFILGAGAYETATRMAQERLASRHGLQVVLAVLKLIGSPELRTPQMIGFGFGGEPDPIPRMLIGVSTLPGPLIYGLNPFWGEEKGPLRWLDIRTNPPHLFSAALRIILKKRSAWMEDAYRSGASEEITLRLPSSFIMDGESFDPGTDGLVHLSAETSATFLAAR